MAIEDDVLVIGGGLAGATAALSAAEHNGTVRLVSYKQSTLRHASGLIDVLGYLPASVSEADGSQERSETNSPLVDPFEAIPSLPEGHPYERVGLETVREALSFFDSITGDAYAGEHTDANALVPTHGGTVKPTARYPLTTAAGIASDPRDTLLVGFETLPDFDASLASDHLQAAGVPFESRGVTLSFPGIKRSDAKITRYAHILERDESVDTGAGNGPARAALAHAIGSELEDESRVGLPAVLGDEHANTVRRDLEERLGVDVFEVPMGPPSLPGIRLEELLYDALEEAGVRVTTGVPVVDYEAASDGDSGSKPEIDHVIVDRKGQRVPYHADQYVLATGGLVGKGVQSDRDRVYEPIFDCHVAHSADRYDWFVEDAFGEQPFAQFGVSVDRKLRPLEDTDGTESGEVEFSNLRAAGAILGGFDAAAEKSASGVSLATGYAAGSRAGREASE